jgi:hypothetical protein
MANVLYDTGREAFLKGEIDWLNDTIKVALVDTGVYTFDSTHINYSSLAGAIVSTINKTLCVKNGTTTVTQINTAGISAGQTVTGPGIPAGTSVVSVILNTSFLMTLAATDSLTSTLTFENQTLTNKFSTDGIANADPITFPTITGVPAEALVIFKFAAVDGDTRLIAYIDTATGLAISPNGGDISVIWDQGANKIFKL